MTASTAALRDAKPLRILLMRASAVGAGLAEIMAEPRRQRRLRAIWSRWDADDYRYMGHPPPEHERS